jgi:thymidylate kinase
MIISLHSIDAGGKGTQAELLRRHLIKRGLKVEVMHFPVYDSVTGRVIQQMLRGEWFVTRHDGRGAWEVGAEREGTTSGQRNEITAVTLQSLMTINRFEHLDKLEAAEHFTDDILVCDRYTADGIAYGVADGLEASFLEKINASLPTPRCAILIDITVDESWKRRPKREDQYEADRGRLERVSKNFLDYFRGHGARHIVDGVRSPEAVAAHIAKIVDEVVDFYAEK